VRCFVSRDMDPPCRHGTDFTIAYDVAPIRPGGVDGGADQACRHESGQLHAIVDNADLDLGMGNWDTLGVDAEVTHIVDHQAWSCPHVVALRPYELSVHVRGGMHALDVDVSGVAMSARISARLTSGESRYRSRIAMSPIHRP
jgi:hypothetical protein